MSAGTDGRNDRLVETLTSLLGADAVVTDQAEREFYSADVYAAGATCAVAIRPTDKGALAKAIGATTSAGYAVIARGGGMSYTRGYVPTREDTVIVDVATLNKIVEINEDDMYITVEAGVTWKQIYDALKPKGLRVPFFGTFSGMRATVGGGLSQGALFMGTARYGQAADVVLGLEVVLADGSVVKTGQGALRNAKPFYKTYGPDLTGMFTHDGGSLGIKVQATFRLIQTPAATDFGSFVFPSVNTVASALSDVARSGAAEDAYVFDPDSTKKNLVSLGIVDDLKTLAGVVTGQSSLRKGLVEGAKLVRSGRGFVQEDMYSLHVVCAGRSEAAVEADLDAIRKIAEKHGGSEIPNSIPKSVRAVPFKPVNGVLGANGDRWAALNAKVPHSQAHKLIAAADELFAGYKERMEALGVSTSHLLIAIDTFAFSFEPVLHWYDRWLPVHERTPEADYMKDFKEPDANPEAAALVEEIRKKLTELFATFGASSNQIGKTYPYLENLDANTARLLKAIKAHTDPDGLFNPGVLGLS